MAYNVANPLPSAARTTTGSTGAVAVDNGDQLAVLLNVTTATGTTPTLDVAVQWSHDGTVFVVPEGTADSFTQVTAAAGKVKSFGVKGPYYRLVYTIGGTTPSFTFSITTYTRRGGQ